VSKILRSLPARWRPKVTAIKKSKFISLKSKGKHSQAFIANESEEESPDGDSNEDPAVVEKMAMLSNKLQYLARKNKKFLSRGSG